MEEGITRKGFIAAAAAVGMAAMVPTVASAEEAHAEPGPLSALDMEAVQGVEALAGSEWAEAAAFQTDVTKSHSGFHMMNEPGYFAFSGWDTTYDQPTDLGFGFVRDRFFVKSRSIELVANGVYGNLADFVVESGSYGIWRYQKWAGGKMECWGKTGKLSVTTENPALGCYYTSYSSAATMPAGWFVETPQVFLGYSLASNGLLTNVNTWALNTTPTNIGITCMSNANQSDLLLICDFHCIGRWK